MGFPDWRPAPNIGRHPDIYEAENEAIARDGRLDAALHHWLRPAGRVVLDIGCGTGFWLPRWAGAARVVGVEPDPVLRGRAVKRVTEVPHIEVLAGSAEHLPLPDASIDAANARFAYFFGPGSERGLEELRRVLRPGGIFVAVDNDWSGGEFAELLRAATGGNADHDPRRTEAWWKEHGAERVCVEGGWTARSPEELVRILGIEFPAPVVQAWRARRLPSATLSYRFSLFILRG